MFVSNELGQNIFSPPKFAVGLLQAARLLRDGEAELELLGDAEEAWARSRGAGLQGVEQQGGGDVLRLRRLQKGSAEEHTQRVEDGGIDKHGHHRRRHRRLLHRLLRSQKQPLPLPY